MAFQFSTDELLRRTRIAPAGALGCAERAHLERPLRSDPAIVGRSISLGDIPYTVTGVLGSFDAELFDQTPDLWVPFQIDPTGLNKDGRLCYGAVEAGCHTGRRASPDKDVGARLRAAPSFGHPPEG